MKRHGIDLNYSHRCMCGQSFGTYVALEKHAVQANGAEQQQPDRHLSDAAALDAITIHLSGREWEASDLEYVARILLLTGRTIEEPS